jgi:hypothetical protein
MGLQHRLHPIDGGEADTITIELRVGPGHEMGAIESPDTWPAIIFQADPRRSVVHLSSQGVLIGEDGLDPPVIDAALEELTRDMVQRFIEARLRIILDCPARTDPATIGAASASASSPS